MFYIQYNIVLRESVTWDVDITILRKYGSQKLAVDPIALAIPMSIPANGGAMSR